MITEQPCRLLAMPAELRNRIWHYALGAGKEVRPGRGWSISVDVNYNMIQRITIDEPLSYHQQPALVQLNRQIRYESRPIYYATDVFLFHLFSKLDVTYWMRWWAALGSDTKHIRRLKILAIAGPYWQHDSHRPRFLATYTITFHEGNNTQPVTVECEVQKGPFPKGNAARVVTAEGHARHLSHQLRHCLLESVNNPSVPGDLDNGEPNDCGSVHDKAIGTATVDSTMAAVRHIIAEFTHLNGFTILAEKEGDSLKITGVSEVDGEHE